MGKRAFAWSSSIATLALLLLSCSPKPPSTTPTATVAPSTPVLAQTLAPDEVAGQKVGADARKEGTLTLYSFSFIGDLGIALSKAFKEKYGINVDLITGTGSQLVPRIQSEYRAGQYTADILEGSPINAIFAKQQGLTQPYGAIPQLKAKDAWVIDPPLDKDGHILPYTYNVYPIWINTKLLTPADLPKSWKALLDPRWKGKIVVTDPDTMPTSNYQYIAMSHYLNLSDDYFRELSNQVVIAPDQRTNDAMVARGEVAMTFTSASTVMATSIAQGAPVAPIDLVDGEPVMRGSAVALLAKASHPNASRLFIDWLMSKEGQDVHGRARSSTSIRKDVVDYSPSAMRIQYTKLIPLSQQDTEDAARAQENKVLSKLGWKGK